MTKLTKKEEKIICKIYDLFQELDTATVIALLFSILHKIGVDIKKEKCEELKKLALKVFEDIEEERSKKDID